MLEPNRRAVLLGAFIALVAPHAIAQRNSGAAQVLALVVANDYVGVGRITPLPATRHDGQDFTAAIKKLPAATGHLLENPSRLEFEEATLALIKAAKPQDTIIFYYAGHGVQRNGMNYLLLNDGKTFIDLSSIVSVLRGAARSLVVIMDACRNDPWAASGAPPPADIDVAQLTTRALAAVAAPPENLAMSEPIKGGLSEMTLSGAGVLIVFSTDPDNVAIDALSGNRNSPFARALVDRLGSRRSFEDVLTDVTSDVSVRTGKKQTPWKQGSLVEPIFLAGRPLQFGSGQGGPRIIP